MKLITAPVPLSLTIPNALFIAGGISGCPDWQNTAISLLSPLPDDWMVMNPRRQIFPAGCAKSQICWEIKALERANAILYWFPKETLCPITLFELGEWLRDQSKAVFVGCHPAYQRKSDVETQIGFIRPSIKVHDDLSSLINEVLRELS
jgi:hypothetical protein